MTAPADQHRRRFPAKLCRRSTTGLILMATLCSLTIAACDGGGGGGGLPTNPVTTVMTLSATPNAIDAFGNSRLRVAASRTDGSVVSGTAVQLTTTLGTLDEANPVTDDSGVATTLLRGNGNLGTAMVEARLGGTGLTAQTNVQIGGTGPSVSVRAEPAVIAANGSSVILVRVVNADNTPRVGERMRLDTTLGRLVSSELTTDSAGSAQTTLRANPGDNGTAIVGAEIAATGERGQTELVIGNDLILSLVAAPSTIAANGTSNIEMTARNFDGSAASGGVRLALSTDLGRLDATSLTTGATGTASTVLRADGRDGVATVTASAVEASQDAQVLVSIGSDLTLTLAASPTRMTAGTTAELTAVVSRVDGTPAPIGTAVSFTTNRGQLTEVTDTTDSSGRALSSLRTSAADRGIATVRAQVVGGATAASVTIQIE